MFCIHFDENNFHAIAYENEIFVLIDDVLDFINNDSLNKSICCQNINKIYNTYKSIDVKHSYYSSDKNTYINWNYIIILTMKFNYEKFNKYKDILEKQLNYKEIKTKDIYIN